MRTLLIYPIDPEVGPQEARTCMLNAAREQQVVPSSLLFLAPHTRRSALLGWAQLHGIPWEDLPAPQKPSRSARLLYHQHAIQLADAVVLMRRSYVPSTHSDLLSRAVRDSKRLFVWFLPDVPHTRPLVLDDSTVLWTDRQQWHAGDKETLDG